MNDLTDFTNTDDVSDAAIEWVRHAIPAVLLEDDCWDVEQIRYDAKKDHSIGDRAMIVAARLIQAHRPELIVDPVDAIVRDNAVPWFGSHEVDADDRYIRYGKDLYLMGLEAGKASK